MGVQQEEKGSGLRVGLVAGKGAERLYLENILSITPDIVASQGIN